MSVVDLSKYPAGTGAVLAVLAARDARDRQSAMPSTLLAAEADRDRAQVQTCCERLAADGYLESLSWEDDGETLDGYFLEDLRVLEQGRAIADQRSRR